MLVAHGFIGTIIVIVMLIDSPPPCNHGRGFPPVIALFVEIFFWFPAGYAPKNSLPSPSCAFLGAALASRRSRPRPVAGRRADISKAPEEVVPLEPNGLPPWFCLHRLSLPPAGVLCVCPIARSTPRHQKNVALESRRNGIFADPVPALRNNFCRRL